MSCSEHIEALRRQNKDLLETLRHKTGNITLQRLNSDCWRRATGHETLEQISGGHTVVNGSASDRTTRRNNSLLKVSDTFSNLSLSGSRPEVARNALSKSINMTETNLTGHEAKRPSENATADAVLRDQENSRLHVQSNPTGTMQPKSIITQDKSQRAVGRVRFSPSDDELETVSESERRVQPLLGYDWIAGLLDSESSLTERSDNFFAELRNFRQVNKEECVHGVSSWPPAAADIWASSGEDNVTDHDRSPDTHQCTFCYRINSRLFATPLDPQAACPVCRMPKEQHPHAENEPAFIRVSIPRSTLLPTHRYKAHRRCSFDPSDSLSLPSHCLSGWSNVSMGAGYEMSSLDLRSSIRVSPNTETVTSAQLNPPGSRLSGSQRSDRLLDVSRLAQFQFQHLAATRHKPK